MFCWGNAVINLLHIRRIVIMSYRLVLSVIFASVIYVANANGVFSPSPFAEVAFDYDKGEGG